MPDLPFAAPHRWLAFLPLLACAACAGQAPVSTAIAFADQDVFPESIAATSAGVLFVGSAGNGSVFRVNPGSSTARLWISPSQSGIRELLGLFADEASGTLYACSIGMSAPPETADALSALHAFDLNTGALKAKYPLPGGARSLCNDIAVGSDETVYVSDTLGDRVLSLNGDSTITQWAADERLAGLNGIAAGSDGALYVASMASGRMFRIPITSDGAAGAIEELAVSRKLDRPDALRALEGNRFVLAENGGHLSLVTVWNGAAQLVPIAEGAGWSSAVRANGRYWAVNPKAEYRMDPSLAGEDPNPFQIDVFNAPD